jgi:hypothetical protein
LRDLAFATDAELRRKLADLPPAARDAQVSAWRWSLPLQIE